MSRLEEIKAIFEEAVREDGWDMDEPKLFSFDIVDGDPDKLENLGEALAAKGYLFVDIFQLGDEATEEPTGEYLLQVDRIDAMTPEGLDEAIEEINAAAAGFGIGEIDGWDMTEADDDEEDESEGLDDLPE